MYLYLVGEVERGMKCASEWLDIVPPAEEELSALLSSNAATDISVRHVRLLDIIIVLVVQACILGEPPISGDPKP
jgi:hypothetical protein